jgi:myosin heavy subunit
VFNQFENLCELPVQEREAKSQSVTVNMDLSHKFCIRLHTIHQKMMVTVHAVPLITLLLIAASTAFTPLPAACHPRTTGRSLVTISSAIHDEAIARLQNEYHELQKHLRQDLMEKGDIDGTAFAESMLEKAADLAAFQRYKQEEAVGVAQKKTEQAKEDISRAQAANRQAHYDAAAAAEQAALVESIDDEYEDLERRRDLSVVHAAHHLEEDSEDQIVEALFQELDAEVAEDAAFELLKQLEEHEKQLKETLKELKLFRKGKAMEEWASDLAKHESFLKRVKTKTMMVLTYHDGSNVP